MAGKHSSAKARHKKYRPKENCMNPLRRAFNTVAILTIEERRVVMNPTKSSLERLRTGACTKQDWDYLADAANIGLQLADQGIGSDEETRAILSRMLVALGGICQRVNAGKSYTPTGPELVAVSEGVSRHDLQLMCATGADLRKALYDYEQAKAQARAGRLPSLSIKAAKVVASEGVPA